VNETRATIRARKVSALPCLALEIERSLDSSALTVLNGNKVWYDPRLGLLCTWENSR
jgi:hypothetical protein